MLTARVELLHPSKPKTGLAGGPGRALPIRAQFCSFSAACEAVLFQTDSNCTTTDLVLSLMSAREGCKLKQLGARP